MSEYTPIPTPEGQDAYVYLEAFLDENGRLGLRTTTAASAIIATHVAIGCDKNQLVRTTIQDFPDATGGTWTVQVDRCLRSSEPWTRGSGEAYDEGVGWTDFIPMTVTAEAANGETKEKKIHVQTKSRQILPIPGQPNIDDDE